LTRFFSASPWPVYLSSVAGIIGTIIAGIVFGVLWNGNTEYTQTDCLVTTTRRDSSGPSSICPYVLCYFAVWDVNYNATISRKDEPSSISAGASLPQPELYTSTIRSIVYQQSYQADHALSYHRVNSSSPCFYENSDPSKVSWFKPTPMAALICLIIFSGLTVVSFAINVSYFIRKNCRKVEYDQIY